MAIKEQNESLTKAESKLKGLLNEGKDLEDKRTVIDKKIADNKAVQQNQVNEVEAQKRKLAYIVAQRKN